jgi:hypothetical protein
MRCAARFYPAIEHFFGCRMQHFRKRRQQSVFTCESDGHGWAPESVRAIMRRDADDCYALPSSLGIGPNHNETGRSRILLQCYRKYTVRRDGAVVHRAVTHKRHNDAILKTLC